MKIIGIDTSTDRGSVALSENGTVIAEGILETRNQHSASLFPVIDRLLTDCGWTRDDLEGIGVGIGPGSFTGIRVGLAGAEGVAAGLNIPLVGIDSFKAAALGSSLREGEISVLCDARRGRLYGARYRKNNNDIIPLSSPRLLSLDEAEAFCRGGAIVSPDGRGLKEILSGWEEAVIETVYPEGGSIALLAENKIGNEGSSPFKPVRPVYLSAYSKNQSKAKKS